MTNMTKENARRFILAPHGKGRAYITFSATGKGHHTYRIAKARDTHQARYFVSVLTGPDNTKNYTYIGQILNGEFGATKGSKLPTTHPKFRAFELVWYYLNIEDALPAWLMIRHEGKCGRCGRKLTVPESIDIGIGPECLKYLGIKTETIHKPIGEKHEWWDGQQINFQGPDGCWYFGDHYEIERVWEGWPGTVTIVTG